MAKATSEAVTVKKMVELVSVSTEYTLTLSQEEAEVLVTVLNHVGGPPAGKRGLAENILKALVAAKVPYDMFGKNDGVRRDVHSIYFE